MSDFDSNKNSKNEIKDIIEKISPDFKETSADFEDIAKYSSDPMVLSALVFKLAQEKEKTNKMLNQIHDKFDKILFELKKSETDTSIPTTTFSVLPEQDQKILDLIETKGMAEARDVMQILEYSGLNAASQRLNKLYKEGHLKKIRSGKKVLYLAKN